MEKKFKFNFEFSLEVREGMLYKGNNLSCEDKIEKKFLGSEIDPMKLGENHFIIRQNGNYFLVSIWEMEDKNNEYWTELGWAIYGLEAIRDSDLGF